MRSCFLYPVVLFVTLLLGIVAAQLVPGRRCGPHEQFVECGTACPAVCGKPPPQACTYQCVAGCFCRPGFIRAINGGCVPERLCVRGG
ncbi:hypothetical protein MRX96_008654 [Rhipicephalus microplus]|uniref:chymotrypsin-elastase inhibitor ixodidin-like n=1 Tax=Rhipicephalus microplus TaxID=6941 RepID=UPI003F6C16AB